MKISMPKLEQTTLVERLENMDYGDAILCLNSDGNTIAVLKATVEYRYLAFFPDGGILGFEFASNLINIVELESYLRPVKKLSFE